MRSLHAAERKLSRASQQAEIARAIADIAARSAQATSAKAQGITGHFADKIAALSKNLSDQERTAAIQQIKLEEAAALANMYLEAAREGEQLRRVMVGPIKTRHRAASTDLNLRQRRERLRIALTAKPSQKSTINRLRQYSSVRRVARRLIGTTSV